MSTTTRTRQITGWTRHGSTWTPPRSAVRVVTTRDGFLIETPAGRVCDVNGLPKTYHSLHGAQRAAWRVTQGYKPSQR